ncbi:hypothetical protein HUJ05_005365 [Dendroctonus ponderosae]|nr:hypothetical protein HUJ05_005365 [Dendroctonus ponderosae]
MLKLCPDPVDVTDLQFKLQSRLKVFHNEDLSQFPHACSLLACASRYGLVFVGTNLGHFLVIQSGAFQQCSQSAAGKGTDSTDYPRQKVELPAAAQHISVNCDSTILAVVIEKDQCPTVIFYEVLSFLRKNLKVLKELRLSMTPGVFVREVNWNPSIPGVFTACKSDGSLGVYELNGDSVSINELPAAANACCFCWSPKGKQIAVGSPDGKITQYKPDLKAVKVTNGPKIERLSSMLSLQWVSTYQFIAVYLAGQDEASVVVVDAPKTGEPSFTDYSDVCYSQAQRSPQFFLLLQQTCMVDTARAELPLGARKENTLPVGFALDISSTTPVPMGESTIPPCPYLCILSHQGVLCCFNAINSKPGVPQVCTPPDPVTDTSGLHKFITPPSAPTTQTPVQQAAAPQEPVPQAPAPSVPAPLAPAPPVSFGIDRIIGQKAAFAGNPQVQSTPIAKGGAALPVSALFGGQTIVTPIKPPTAPKTLFGGQTAVVPVTPTAPLPVKAKPIVISAEQKVNKIKSANKTNQVVINPAQVLTEMIREEWSILENELRNVSEMSRRVKVSVGSDSEMVLMTQQIKSLEEFIQDLETVNGGQSGEIQCLKQNTIQAWAWFEEAKSYYQSSKNEAIALLIKAQPLDSLSQKRLKDIEQLAYYIESQLSQANKTLDEQWGNFQDYARKTHRVKMPTMETIFQTMVRQNAVLQKHAFVLKDIQMRTRRKSSIASALLLKLDKESSFVDDFAALHLTPQSLLKLQHEKIRKHSQHLSAGKSSKLRQLLNQREITQVQAVKPQVSSWAINQSPARKLRQSISKLNSSQSLVAKTLDLSQSSQLDASEVVEATVSTPRTASFPFTLASGPAISSFEGSAFTRIGSLASKPSSDTASPTFTTAKPAFTLEAKPQATSTSAPQVQATKFFGSPAAFGGFQQFGAKSGPSFGAPAQTAPAHAPAALNLAKTTTSLLGRSDAPVFAASSTATATISIFGRTVTSSAAPLPTPQHFGSPSAALASTPTASVFGKNTASTFSPSVSSSPASTASVFGKSTASTFSPAVSSSAASTASAFGKSSAPTFSPAVSSSPASTASVFGNSAGSPFSPAVSSSAASTGSVFGKNTASIFTPAVSSTASVSGKSTAPAFSPPVSSSASVFGKSAAPAFSVAVSSSPASTASVFGSSAGSTFSPAVSSSASVFGKSTGSIFSPAVSSSPAPTASVFGQSTAAATSAAGSGVIFSTPTSAVKVTSATAAATTGSVFGKDSILGAASAAASPSAQTTSTTASIFGGAPASTAAPAFGGASLFAAVSTSVPPAASSSSGSLFGSPATPAFGAAAPTTTAGSTFGAAASSSVAGASSGSPSILAALAASSPSTVFGAAASTASLAGSRSSTGSIFATPTASSAPTVFGASSSTTAGAGSTGTVFATPAASSSSAVFGASTTSTALTSGSSSTGTVFGTPAASSSSAVFGAATSTTAGASSTGTVFGTPAASSSSAVFGASTSTTSATTNAGVFGGSSTHGVFGSASPSAGSSVFGASTSAASSGSLFGKSTSSSAGSIFGAPTTSSVFGGSNNATVANPIFGAAAPQSAFQAQPGAVFGAPSTTSSVNTFGSPTFASTASGFGQPPAFGASSGGSVFGATTTAASGSIFGAPPATSSSGFGTTATTAFGASTTPKASSGPFGFGALSVGSPASSSSNIFGASSGPGFGQTAPAAKNIFGSPTTTASSIFGSPTTTASSIFGASTGATFGSNAAGGSFGAPPAFGGGSSFGAKPAFGQTAAFGASPSFGSPQTGAFSAAAGSPVAQSGFGSAASFQKPSGFGSAPVFGASPAPAAFGSPPSFGSSPSFGAAPSFGTPEKVFGGSQPPATGGFAAATPENTGFGNLASQNTIGFGNLAQQATSPPAAPFSGFSSFSSWR